MKKEDKINFEKDIKKLLILERKFKKFKKTEEYKLVQDIVKTRNKIRSKVKTQMEDNKIFSRISFEVFDKLIFSILFIIDLISSAFVEDHILRSKL